MTSVKRITVPSARSLAYLDWLLAECTAEGTDPRAMIEADALDFLAEHLTTTLQIAVHLTRAFEEGFRFGRKPITRDVVAATLSPQFDDLEPRLTRSLLRLQAATAGRFRKGSFWH